MISVQINKRDFEYDIHSLVKAFYPASDVRVSTEEADETAELKISVFYEKNQITAALYDQAGKLLSRSAVPIQTEADTPQAEHESGPAQPERRTESDCGENETAALQAAADTDEKVARGEARPAVKSALKKMLYELLSAHTGKSLPWGDLTGIRPTKIPMAFLEQGWKNSAIAAYMREQYNVSVPKAALAVMIANREKHLLDRMDYRNGYSLYVGIPFCPSICLYCSFSSSPIGLWQDRVDTYLDALMYEIEESAHLMESRQLQTVYIGGGTPTTLSPAQLDRLLTKLVECFDYSHLLEFTVEAGRPDSITRDKLEVIRKHGIGRISINPQTMNQETLDVIGRRHTVGDIRDAFGLAREMGFENINMDLIIGLPGEGLEEVRHTMEELEKLDPDSVTVHSLALKRAARLSLMKDRYWDMSFTNSDQIMDLTMRSCETRGLAPYYLYRQKNMAGNFENVGYAREGKECLYNILIMEEVQSILALGAGASTKIVHESGLIERVENVKDITNYIERIDEMIERKRVKLAQCDDFV